MPPSGDIEWGCGFRAEMIPDKDNPGYWKNTKYCPKHIYLEHIQAAPCSIDKDDYNVVDCNVSRTDRYCSRRTSYGVILTMCNCGIILNFNELYRSESPTRVLHHLCTTINCLSPSVPLPKYLIYDNACGLLLTFQNRFENGHIHHTARTDALDNMIFLIDKFHIGNHTRPMCQAQTNPYKYPDVNGINTVVCEQTNLKLKKYQNTLSSFSFPKSKIFYLLLFNFMNYPLLHLLYVTQRPYSSEPLNSTKQFTPDVLGGKLSASTVCPSAQHALSSHYNLHNIALKAIRGKRPFVLSRSSFAGSGQYTAHWTGDNKSTFKDMYFSISAILSFNMFGLTNVGADICGFGLDTTEELCTRWMQLGAFYPFMRNHNAGKDQDPAVFSWTAQQIMKQAVLMRYSLTPFWYTLHYQATVSSKTLIQPLHFEFSDDENTLGIDQQFLLGRAILVSPNLISNTTTVNAYFPRDIWYQYPSGKKVESVGVFANLDAPLDKINVHIRGGFIIPMQIPGDNLMLSRGNPFILIVALSSFRNATGNLFWDDGDSIETKIYNYFEFSSVENTLTINATVTNYTDSPMRLELVRIFGVNQSVTDVIVNGKEHIDFFYNISDQVLVIYALDLAMIEQTIQTIQWITMK
ncbi:unnamed protein product [Adineta ricciae]|uniref:Lysosomal alpha-glucosidase n=1 Tax=Adineta ricciae TaxID=249248 RepID=A0A816CBU8_ADIRI|nr:unnamed protein product [Adineta ricciae]